MMIRRILFNSTSLPPKSICRWKRYLTSKMSNITGGILFIFTVTLALVLVDVHAQDLPDQPNQSKKCTQYGHSCLGGHGKRSTDSSFHHPLLTDNNQGQMDIIQMIQQLNQQKHLKPLSIPMYIYRNSNVLRSQTSPTTMSATNDDDLMDDFYRFISQYQKADVESLLQRLTYLEKLLLANNLQEQINGNNDVESEVNKNKPSLIDRIRARLL